MNRLTRGLGMLTVGVMAMSLAAEDTTKKPSRKEEPLMRKTSMNNLKQILIAMHNRSDSRGGRFPQNAIFKGGKPLLSWRVALLPYLEQQKLYEQFKLDEPWDSKHNKKLIAKMPKVYRLPVARPKPGMTHYQVLVGGGAAFSGQGGGPHMPRDFLDGTANTIVVVEAANAVPWTKPVDLPYDSKKPLPAFGKYYRFAKGFLVGMADGSVRSVTDKVSETTLRRAIMRNDGQPLGSDW